MRIAIIGAGISGLTTAYYLNKHHDIELFEKRDRLGGHTATKRIELDGKKYEIDTGFIVFNDRTYPNFIRLMNELNVSFSETSMGFSVSSRNANFEYAGKNLNTLFAQRKNIFSPFYWRFVKDILRFNKQAQIDYKNKSIPDEQTLKEYLDINQYSEQFAYYYLIPMGAAIWSASFASIMNFPITFFIKFFFNHGLLDVLNRPKWRVIDGGSKSYIDPLTKQFKDKIQLNADIASIKRNDNGVQIKMNDGEVKAFDKVVFACHSDQALNILSDATEKEQAILGSIPYQDNSVVLHYDEAMLPKRKRTWSSWNYSLREKTSNSSSTVELTHQQLPVLTYNMNILQHIKSDRTFCVTLNAEKEIDESKILGKYTYAHPQFSLKAMSSQQRWHEINNHNHTFFCGAYWANGFHEDGVTSALKVVETLGVTVK